MVKNGEAGKKPKYLIIINSITEGIISGKLQPGTRLPSELFLAQQFETTRSTVVRALQQLAFEGFISREQGRGTFVKPLRLPTTLDMSHIRSFEDEVIAMGAAVEYRLISFSLINPSAEVIRRMKLADKSEVYHLQRLRLINNNPAVFENRYITLPIGECLSVSNLSTMPMYEILNTIAGTPVTHVDGIIRVMAATKNIAAHLGVKTSTPILVRDYLLSNQDHGPLICGEAYYLEQYPVKYQIRSHGITDQ